MSSTSHRRSNRGLARVAALRWLRPLLSGGRWHCCDAAAARDARTSSRMKQFCLPVGHETSLLVQKGWMRAERHGEDSHFGPAFPEMMQGGVEIAIGWLMFSPKRSQHPIHPVGHSSIKPADCELYCFGLSVTQRNVAIAGSYIKKRRKWFVSAPDWMHGCGRFLDR